MGLPQHQVIDLKDTFEPIAMLHISKTLREMSWNQILEIRVYDLEFLKHINRLFTIYAPKLSKEESIMMPGGFWRLIIQPKSIGEEKMSEMNLSEIKAASTVDARGSACPGPLLEAKKGIGKVKVGEVLEVFSNDPGTRTDIPAWAEKVGHEFIGAVGADGYDKLYVRRKK